MLKTVVVKQCLINLLNWNLWDVESSARYLEKLSEMFSIDYIYKYMS